MKRQIDDISLNKEHFTKSKNRDLTESATS